MVDWKKGALIAIIVLAIIIILAIILSTVQSQQLDFLQTTKWPHWLYWLWFGLIMGSAIIILVLAWYLWPRHPKTVDLSADAEVAAADVQ